MTTLSAMKTAWLMAYCCVVPLAGSSFAAESDDDTSGLKPNPPIILGRQEFREGVAAYQKKDYKSAEQLFTKSVTAGNKTAAVWLYSGHTFLALGRIAQAKKTYEVVIASFKDSPEAKIASSALETIKNRKPVAKPDAKPAAKPGAPAAAAAAPAAAPEAAKEKQGDGMKNRITVVPPYRSHPAVSKASIAAVREGVANLPQHIRAQLEALGASVVIAPNMLDKWPDSINGLDEEKDELNLAEQPGRIYGTDMYVYERAKLRGADALKSPRSPADMKHTVLNECFQVLDADFKISKDPALRKEYRAEADAVPDSLREDLGTYLKEDDWGARETCSELSADLFGSTGGAFRGELVRCFPRTKRWLKAKLGI
ncbi:MAG: hypothetical protein K2X93_26745 [Candidatus Obscuribacterales bacterium]|nr:hypothetical protein [Candidatus Obscuribacterales bacterium]